MNIEFNVNTDSTVVLTNKLEKLHRAAFPNAVRGTLNSLAFDVKSKTMPEQVQKDFVNRQKNFFKANSRVEKAVGFNVDNMSSAVGFKSLGKKNKAVDDLEQQERGGVIGGRSFVPMDSSRVSRSSKRNVSKRNRISGIKNIVKTKEMPGSSKGVKLIKAVTLAERGGYVLTDNALMRVENLKRKSGRWKFKLKAIYSFKKDRTVKIKATHFMKKATEITAKKIDKIYFDEAERQFNKYMK